VQNSLVAGKNAGNFAESAAFCENPSRKHLLIQVFADKFPTQASRELFCARREFIPALARSREFRAKPNRSPRGWENNQRPDHVTAAEHLCFKAVQ
jgi:hypothetical protein